MNRRFILAGAPMAALTAPQRLNQDHDLIAACDRYFELERYFEGYGEADVPRDDPALDEFSGIVDRIAALRASTLEGFYARARVLMSYEPVVVEVLLGRNDGSGLFAAIVRDLVAGA